MSDNISVEGEIDAGFNSYFDKDTLGQMSETIDGTSDDDMHSEITEILPSDIDPEDLTDKQRTVLEEAIANPYQSAANIDEIIGSENYANSVLKKKAPEFYQNVFKQRGKSKHGHVVAERREQENQSDGQEAPVIEAESTPEGVDTQKIKNAIAAIEATAQTDETKQAMEHIKGLL